jgi:taurine dioxygenase
MAMSVSFETLPTFGVEIDADLRAAAHDDDVKALFEEHGFLLFRNQQLTPEQQRRVLARLGPVLDDFTTAPSLGISLHAIDVQYEKTWTRFVSSIRALQALPRNLKKRIEGLEGLNLFTAAAEAPNGHQRLEGYSENAPRMKHPLISFDPITKADAVCNRAEHNTRGGYGGLGERGATRAIRSYIYTPDNTYEHRWRNGDLLIWSNQGYQHARGGLTPGIPCTLQRVCIAEATADMHRPPIPADRLPPERRATY